MSKVDPVFERMKRNTTRVKRLDGVEDCRDCSGSIEISKLDFDEVGEQPNDDAKLNALASEALRGAAAVCRLCPFIITDDSYWDVNTQKGKILVAGQDTHTGKPGRRTLAGSDDR